jgi:NhaP-type Na+/H+ or K+/H+ antiporter
MVNLAVLGSVLFCFALCAGRVEGTAITAPMVFVTAGLVAAWAGLLDLRSPTHAAGASEASREVVLVVAELALVLLLFTDAARIKVRALRGNPLPLRLLCIGLPLTIALGSVVAVALLSDLELWECAIVAAVLAPTDAALGQAVVTNPALPLRIRQGLNVESGLNDGGSVPFLTLFIGLAAAEEGVGGGWLRFAVEQIGYGTLIGAAAGVAGGWGLRHASERGWTVPLFEKLALAALAVIAFVAADEMGGNGFIAAFVGGGATRVAAGPVTARALDFAEEDGEVLNLAIFFIFGLFAAHALGDASWQMVAYAVLSLTVIRMLPVAVSVIGLGLRPATIGFLGWFGPRGLASIILGLVVVEDAPELQGIEQIFVVMTVTVLMSVFAHGITAAPLSRRYAHAREAAGADEPEHGPVAEIPTRWRGAGKAASPDARIRR